MNFEKLISCNACSLCNNRQQVVLGEGNLRARLFIIGDYPGVDEDLEGVPFSGRAGKMLEKMLELAGIGRNARYITNAVKCLSRKAPTATQVKACKGWLWEEFKMVQPKVIVPMGNLPAKLLMPGFKTMKTAIKDKQAVNWFGFETTIMPCYGPSFLLSRGSGIDTIVKDRLKEAYRISCEEVTPLITTE